MKHKKRIGNAGIVAAIAEKASGIYQEKGEPVKSARLEKYSRFFRNLDAISGR